MIFGVPFANGSNVLIPMSKESVAERLIGNTKEIRYLFSI